MKLWLKHIGILVAVAGVVGLAAMLSGIIPIAASGGHWSVTRKVLDFSMARSVFTHSIGIDAPELDDPEMIQRGAGHFETGCVQCHGSPARPQSPIASAMTPRPPLLPAHIPLWKPQELFYIVKHGVKLTGMPAWPAQNRDDEVWDVVAFLQTLPDIDADAYRELVTDSNTAVSEYSGPPHLQHLVTSTCGRCHGTDGRGRSSEAFPALAGQHQKYLAASLRAYSAGERHSGIMQPLAVPLTDSEITDLAEYYSKLPTAFELSYFESPPADTSTSDDTADELTGFQIAQNGIPSQKVPSCTGCHGPGRSDSYPLLSGQPTSYLAKQLTLFKRRDRGGTEQQHLMHPATDRITEKQIQAAAQYFGERD